MATFACYKGAIQWLARPVFSKAASPTELPWQNISQSFDSPQLLDQWSINPQWRWRMWWCDNWGRRLYHLQSFCITQSKRNCPDDKTTSYRKMCLLAHCLWNIFILEDSSWEEVIHIACLCTRHTEPAHSDWGHTGATCTASTTTWCKFVLEVGTVNYNTVNSVGLFKVGC